MHCTYLTYESLMKGMGSWQLRWERRSSDDKIKYSKHIYKNRSFCYEVGNIFDGPRVTERAIFCVSPHPRGRVQVQRFTACHKNPSELRDHNSLKIIFPKVKHILFVGKWVESLEFRSSKTFDSLGHKWKQFLPTFQQAPYNLVLC